MLILDLRESTSKTYSMNPSEKSNYLAASEKKSIKLLMEKMGLGKKELEQISSQYGVSASQLIEVMQYSKYQFVYQKNIAAHCQPCNHLQK